MDGGFESPEGDHINWDRTVASKNGLAWVYLTQPVEESITHYGDPNLPYECGRKTTEKNPRSFVAVGINDGGPSRSVRVQISYDHTRWLRGIEQWRRWRKGDNATIGVRSCNRKYGDLY